MAGYAHYKLGFVYWNRGDIARALEELTKTIEVAERYPAVPSASQLARTAPSRGVQAMMAASAPLKVARAECARGP